MYPNSRGGSHSNGQTPVPSVSAGGASGTPSALPAFSHPHSGIRTPPNGPSPHGSPFASAAYHAPYSVGAHYHHPHSSMSRASSVAVPPGWSPAPSQAGRRDAGDEDEEEDDEEEDDDDEDDDEDEEGDDDDNDEGDSDNSSPRSSSSPNAPRSLKRKRKDEHANSRHPSASTPTGTPSQQQQNLPSGPHSNKPKPPRGSKACTHCRKLKMRCTGGENGPPCDRCRHSGYTCVFEESNRGKKAAANAAAAAKAKAEKQEAAAAAKAAALAAAASSSSSSGTPAAKRDPSPASLMAGFPSNKTKKGKQSNQDLARSLEKMEATLNTVLRTMRDPAHAHSLGQASGMLTRPQSPAREDKRREYTRSQPHIPTGTIDPTQTQSMAGSATTTANASTSQAARYASMAPAVAFSGPHVGGSASSSNIPLPHHRSSASSRRAPSPRLHSLPPDSLNPLGLLAEASLGNQMSASRRSKSSQGASATSASASGSVRGDESHSSAQSRRGGSASATSGTASGGTAGDGVAAADGTKKSEEEEDEAAAIRKGSWTSTDAPALGVASKAYFRPGPMSMLPLRKVIIDRELPPELLTSGIVSDAEVLDLFSIFFHNCAQHIILLDPEWHTPQFVCGRSPFLFTVILAIASRYYAPRPDLHTKCLQQATKEAFRCLEKGFKSIEIVQAFLLLTMWGQPARRFEEDKSWIFAGIAFRVATDLNLHRKSTASMAAAAAPHSDDPAVIERDKEIRNRERTWIFCFVVDRSLSSQMGKPSVIREDYIIRNTRSWSLERSAALSDVALGALTELLRLTSRQMELLYSSQTSVTGLNSDLDFSAMIKIFHEQMEEWRVFWQVRGLVMGPGGASHSAPAMDDTLSAREVEMSTLYAAANRADPPPDDADHTLRTLYFLIQQAPLRYHYASLVIHSFGLQFGNLMDRGAYFYRCYEAAKGVYFAARDGMKPVLRYAPDTQILIISFALIFMLKLTRPTFSNYADSEEIFTLVEEGADMLEQVAAGPTHTPALYGHFIRSTLSHAKAEKASRNSGEGTQGSTSRAQTPNGVPYSEGAGGVPTAASAFELPTDAALDPMLGAGAGGMTSGRATRTNSISGAANQQHYDGGSLFGGGFGGLNFGGGGGGTGNMSGPFSFPNGMSMGGGGLSASTAAPNAPAFTGSDAGSFMLDNVWWNQLVPAGLGGPLDGLNGGIDMQPVFAQSQSQQPQQYPTSRSQSIHIPTSTSTSTSTFPVSSSFLGGNAMGDGFGSIVGMGLDLGASLGLTSSPDVGRGAGTGVTRPNSPHHGHVRFRDEHKEDEGGGDEAATNGDGHEEKNTSGADGTESKSKHEGHDADEGYIDFDFSGSGGKSAKGSEGEGTGAGADEGNGEGESAATTTES